MKNLFSRRHEGGTALVFSLLILLIMTIIGVAVMSNTQMQERMSGNMVLQTQAFEAASAGVSEALRFGMNEFFGDPDASTTPTDLGEARCTIDRISEWRDGVISKPRFGTVTDLSLMKESVQSVNVQYQLRAECFKDPGLEDTVPSAEGYVTSLGRVMVNDDELATREVEVRVDDFRIDGLSAIRVEGDATVDYDAANAKKYFIGGAGGPAVTASTTGNAGDIVTAIESAADGTRLANYDGGVSASKYDPPFSEAWQLARFVLEIKAFLEFHGLRRSDIDTQLVGGLQCDDSKLPSGTFPKMGLIDGPKLNVTGVKSFAGITYVEGDLDMRGSAEGAGMVIVEGDVTWAGTDQFKGLVLTLGGDLAIGGGGSAETIGMLYVANLDLVELSALYEIDLVDTNGDGTGDISIRDLAEDPAANWADVLDAIDALGNPDPDGDGISDNLGSTAYSSLHASGVDGFGKTTVTFLGGGRHQITYDCESFDNPRKILKACGQSSGDGDDTADGAFGFFKYDGLADPWADAGCGRPGEGGTVQSLRSWRENLGWRELLGSTP